MAAEAFPHVAQAAQYVDDVLTGRISACHWVQRATLRHRNDLARQNTPEFPYRFDEALAERACKFKSLMPHVKGRWARKKERFALQAWQCFITASIFGWVHVETGFRRFQEVYECIPRKNGKSFDAATTGLYMFAVDNEPGAEVYSGATSEKQAWEVFKPAREMCLATPEFCYKFGIAVRATSIVRVDDGSKLEPVIGKPGDGASPHCAIIDEFHEHTTPDLYDTMALGMGAREQPLIFIITTAGTSLSGPCYQRQLYAQAVLDGKVVDESLFAIIYTIDEGDDWTTIEAAQKANPNYGVSILKERIERDLKSALQSAYLQNAYKTKRLNIWCGAKAAWMNMQAWLACPQARAAKKLRGRECYGGIDLGVSDDLTALALLFPPIIAGTPWELLLRFYLPEAAVAGSENGADYEAWHKQGWMELTPGNVSDLDRIRDDAVAWSKEFRVIEWGFDPWQAAHLASILVGRGLKMVKVPQNPQHLSEPMKLFSRLVLAKQLAHQNNPVLNWNIGNTVAKQLTRDNILPDKPSPEAKIDGTLATLNAASRAFANSTNLGLFDEWLNQSSTPAK